MLSHSLGFSTRRQFPRGARLLFTALALPLLSLSLQAGVGDPQIATDHPWYPGELACSTFERLFATQARVFEEVTGLKPVTDEQKVLAAWMWRNTHYAHGEEGAENLWGKGFGKGGDARNREYWTGLFSHGFALCGTTHSQWTAEMNALLGHNRGRGVGVAGHNSFEAFLTGGAYGAGKWVMVDHDVSAVAFAEDGSRLLSIAEVQQDWKRLLDSSHAPERQKGWPVCGLHPGDASAFQEYNVAEYLAGYEGAPPIVHLRRGESLRRYLQPGLEDGKTFAFWGRNYKAEGIPGPERSLTWVGQPEAFYNSIRHVRHQPGQARYGNAVFTYRPDFAGGGYREGVISEDSNQVTLEFYSPYVIAANPSTDAAWGIYEPGGKNGLVVTGNPGCEVSISVDQGQTWQPAGRLQDRLDLTDLAKGHRQYFLRLHAGAKQLERAAVTITTVCQANPATMPQLKEEGSAIRFEASGKAVVSAGPNLSQAAPHVVAGGFGTPNLTLELSTPRGERPVAIRAAAHVASGNPPDSKVKYQIEASTDGGKTWLPVAKDWSITRRGDEPKGFWSQSMCWGSLELPASESKTVQVRFSNDGKRNYLRAEAHLVYATNTSDRTKATFAWSDDQGTHEVSNVFTSAGGEWQVPTGKSVQTRWVQFEPMVQTR
jgi:hypothetical protein